MIQLIFICNYQTPGLIAPFVVLSLDQRGWGNIRGGSRKKTFVEAVILTILYGVLGFFGRVCLVVEDTCLDVLLSASAAGTDVDILY